MAVIKKYIKNLGSRHSPLTPMTEHQIAQLLHAAKEQLEYCNVIVNYPAKAGRRNFDVIAPVDKFYKTVCNMAFNDTVLIAGSLLDKKDARVISLWNFKDFVGKKQKELQQLTDKFTNYGLKTIRDQIIAHQDMGNKNNNIPNSRRRGIINLQLIKLLQEILEEMVKEFRDYASNFSRPYGDQYFNTTNARQEVELILNQAKPTLTDDFVI